MVEIKEQPKKLLSAWIDPVLHDSIKIQAIRTGVHIKEILNDILKKYYAGEGKIYAVKGK